MNPNNKGRGISLLLIIALIFAMFYLLSTMNQSDTAYSQVVNKFLSHSVTEFNLDIGSGKLTYKLQGETKPNVYSVPDVGLFLKDIKEYTDYVNQYNIDNPNNQIKYTYSAPSSTLTAIINLLPYLMLAGSVVFFMVMMSRQNGGGKINSFGKAHIKELSADARQTTFADVAGADEEKEELQEIVEFLKHPSKFNSLGGKVPKGVLLVGPPGTGKTLLARAVAGEAKVPFFPISGSNFVEVYVGIGASRVRDLFDKAKKNAPSIIFIDEIDAVGRQRGAGLGGGNDEREQTLNQLLVEMDGFENNSGVIVIAATNRSDVLDNALLRPGRFDRQVYVNLPDLKGREEILKVHARNKPFAPDVDLSVVAKVTPGFTGADLENVLNEAALAAAKLGRKAITEKDIEDATTKVIGGPEKRSRVITPQERKLTAYHEVGHAIVTYYVSPETPVKEISIIPRGMAGGYTLSLPESDKNFVTKTDMTNKITTLLGGRVAEMLTLNDISTGASNDLERASAIARAMVTKYGFSEALGPVVYGSDHDEVFLGRDWAQNRSYSEDIANKIDAEIKKIVDGCFEAAKKLLVDHMDQVETVAKALIEYEKIDGDSFKKLIEAPADTKAEPTAL